MLWTEKSKILIAGKNYQHHHLFHEATRQKRDIDETGIEKKNRREGNRLVLFLKLMLQHCSGDERQH